MPRLPRIVLVAALLVLVMSTSAFGAPRITNGQPLDGASAPRDWPFLVALIDRSAATEYDGQFCGGMLIDDRHVLTAAHCVVSVEDRVRYRNAPSSVGIGHGILTLDQRRQRPDRLTPVEAIFVHPAYVAERDQWDIALLRLSRPIAAPTIPLVSFDDEVAIGFGTTTLAARVAGWGDTNPLRDDCCVPATARATAVPIHPTETCATNADSSPLYFYSEYQLCAGSQRRGTTLGSDTCQGDSGGPLVIDVAGVAKLAGVTSRGAGCGQSFFGQYTRSSAALGWVRAFPGSLPDDVRPPTSGASEAQPPSGLATRAIGNSRFNVRWSAPTTGPAPLSYTIWMRVGPPAEAIDVYLGRTSGTALNVRIPFGRAGNRYPIIARSFIATGESTATRALSTPLR